jgi:hypothetical protein
VQSSASAAAAWPLAKPLDAHRGLRIAGVAFAFLMPVVGFIIGIVLLTKDQVSQGIITMVGSVVMFGIYYDNFIATGSYL